MRKKTRDQQITELVIRLRKSIAQLMQESIEDILAVGRDLTALYGCRASGIPGLLPLSKANWSQMNFPMTLNYARQIIRMVNDPKMANPENWDHFPAHRGTLIEISRLSDDMFAYGMQNNIINQRACGVESLAVPRGGFLQLSRPICGPPPLESDLYCSFQVARLLINLIGLPKRHLGKVYLRGLAVKRGQTKPRRGIVGRAFRGAPIAFDRPIRFPGVLQRPPRST
jgi:hypothetical protein